MPMTIESVTTAALSAALDAASRRHGLVAANIANANTQGYTPSRLSFSETLADARATFAEKGWIAPAHVDAIGGAAQALVAPAAQDDKVQLDLEMADLAQNAVHFQALTQALSRHLGMLAAAAADGRK